MTMLTRWDPFRELSVLQDRMNRLFQDFAPRATGEEGLTAGNFVPPVDIYEDEHNITLKVEVPGLDPKDVDVRLEGNTLTIKGERKFEKKEGSAGYERLERFEGSFQRQFVLPDNVKADEIKARHNNGVLEVAIPKQAQALPRRINVDVN